MRSRSPRRHRGFTLIEVLIAGILLAASIAVMGTAVSRSYRGSADANDDRRAALLLSDLMTKIDLIGPARLASEGPRSGSFDGEDSRFSWSVEIQNRQQGHLYQVNVTLSWTAGTTKRRAQVQTLLDDPPKSHDASIKWRDL